MSAQQIKKVFGKEAGLMFDGGQLAVKSFGRKDFKFMPQTEFAELAVNDPETLFAEVRNAGSVFLGRNTPEAVGDYVGGPNHVLPTGRRARFASGLSVLDFMKRTSFLGCSKSALAAIGPAAITFARAEGLPAHALSVEKRLK